MSMFHELMMRKKEEIMYATIKGTLTENNGVFSGFSSNNYLATQMLMTSEMQVKYRQSFTVQMKITLPNSFNTEQQIIHIPYRGILSGITIRDDGKIRWYVISSQTSIYSTTIFTTGATIYIKGVISNEVATLYSSTDGVNWVNEGTANLTSVAITETDTPILFGVNQNKLSAFEGSIDLNKSYIKLGSTKYNLQAVVGYTIVGSPTIVDGVVSGFSSENYLTIGSSFSSNDYDVIEFNTKITTGNSIADGLIIGINGYYVLGLAIINSKFYCRVNFGSYSNIISDITPQANTTYTIKGIIDKKNSTANINVNGTKNSETFTYDSARSGQYRSGYSSSIGTFNGSIDLNSTNIKRNNKLWFNGQQA